jgi:hypothetical protein
MNVPMMDTELPVQGLMLLSSFEGRKIPRLRYQNQCFNQGMDNRRNRGIYNRHRLVTDGVIYVSWKDFLIFPKLDNTFWDSTAFPPGLIDHHHR